MKEQHDHYSKTELAGLGDGKIAYLKPMTSDEVRLIYPGAPALESGLQLFALVGANGAPIILADSVEGALANAVQQQLQMVSIH